MEAHVSDKHYDQLETRDPAQRELAQFNLLPDLVRHAMANAPGWAAQLKGVDAGAVTSRAALARLPVLRKTALKDLQAKSPPYGGFTTAPAASARAHLHVARARSSSPRASARTGGARRARCSRRACARATSSTTPSPITSPPARGSWTAGARALGCAVIAAGPGNTEQQLDVIQYVKPTAYVGVPDYLKILLDKAKEAGKDASSFKKALVGGAALFPSLQGRVQGARHRHLPDLCHGRRRHHRLRERGARGHDRRRGRDPGDRAAGHRRSGAGGRGRRGRRHHLQPRLPDDPLRHRRPVRGAAGHRARAGAPTCASRAGSAAPTRPPRSRACSCIPSRWRRWPSAMRASDACAWWWAGRASRTS